MKKLVVMLLLCNYLLACNFASKKQANKETTPQNESSLNEKASIKYDAYCNNRFEFCVDYPKDLLLKQPESTNGDGCVFKNQKGETVLTVFGRINTNAEAEMISLSAQFNEDLASYNNESSRVTYQKLSKSFYVISGLKDNKIFYQKTILNADAFNYAILEYDTVDSSIFNTVSSRIFSSFK